MADVEFEKAAAELRAAFADALRGVAQDASEARTLAGIAAGYPPRTEKSRGVEKSIGEQLFGHEIKDHNGDPAIFETYVRDGNARIVAIQNAVGRLEGVAGRIEAAFAEALEILKGAK